MLNFYQESSLMDTVLNPVFNRKKPTRQHITAMSLRFVHIDGGNLEFSPIFGAISCLTPGRRDQAGEQCEGPSQGVSVGVADSTRCSQLDGDANPHCSNLF